MENIIQVRCKGSLESFTDPTNFSGYNKFPLTVPFCECFVEEGGRREFQRFDHAQSLSPKSTVPPDLFEDLDYSDMECDDFLDLPSGFIGWRCANGDPVPVGTTMLVRGYCHDAIFREQIIGETSWKDLHFGTATKTGSSIQYEINRFWSKVVGTDIPYFNYHCDTAEYYSVMVDSRCSEEVSKAVVFHVYGMPILLKFYGGVAKCRLFRYQSENSVQISQINAGTPIVSASISVLGDPLVYLATYGVGEFENVSQKVISELMKEYCVIPTC